MRDRLYSAILVLAAAALAVLVFTGLRSSLGRVDATAHRNRGMTTTSVPPPPPMPSPASGPSEGSGAGSDAPAGAEVFRGRVLLADERTPAAAASYRVTSSGRASGGVWEATTNGEFTVTGLEPGSIRAEAMAPGHAEVSREFTLPQAPGETAVLVLPRPGARLEVTVMGSTRGALTDTALTPSLTWRIGGTTRSETPELTTDSGGRFTIAAPPGATSVTIRATESHPPATVEVPSGPTIARVELRPYGSFAVRGSVVGADGAPACRAEVTLTPADREGPPRVEFCDGDGAYTFYGVAPGKITLRAAADKGEPADPVTLDYDGAADVAAPRLKLGPGGRLEVVVRGPAGPIADGVSVSALRRPDPSARDRTSYAQFAAKAGSPWLRVAEGIARGPWEVQVNAKGYESRAAEAVVQPGKTTSIAVALKPLWTVGAKVLSPEGRPLANVDAVVTYTYTGSVQGGPAGERTPAGRSFSDSRTRRVKTDANGAFTIGDLPTQGTSLAVTTKEGNGEVEGLGRLATPLGRVDAVVRLDPPAAIEGVVLPQGVTLRSRGLAVVLFRGNMPRYEPLAEGWDELGAQPDNPLDERRIVFEPKGPGFRFDNIVPADRNWSLCVVHRDVVSIPVPVRLAPGQTLAVELPATRPGRLTGCVVDGRGRGVPGVSLTGRMPGTVAGRAQGFPSHAPTDDGGRFVVEDLPPGKWQVGCTTPEASGWTEVRVDAGATRTVKVKLSPRQARRPYERSS